MAMTPVSPETATGTRVPPTPFGSLGFASTPSSPVLLSPQHTTVPSASRAPPVSSSPELLPTASTVPSANRANVVSTAAASIVRPVHEYAPGVPLHTGGDVHALPQLPQLA